jgi:multiple sugar transport system ATP-binding protein
MRNGRIQQVGSPTELYEQPKNTYVASFIGSPPMNFLEARIDGDRILLLSEETTLAENSAIRQALARAPAPEVSLGIRPEHIVFSEKPAGADAFSIAGAVDTVEPLGHTTLVRAKMPSQRVLNVLLEGKVRLHEGQAVHAIFPANRVYLFDRKTEQSLLGISQ